MKNGKKILTIASIVFLIAFMVIVNNWITKQVEGLSTVSALKKKDVAKVAPRNIVPIAMLPTIDPMDDPLAPVVKKIAPNKKTMSAPKTMKPAPKRQYEFSTDEEFLIQ